MNQERNFLFYAAGVCLIFAAVNLLLFLGKRGRTCQTTGTVISFSTLSPEENGCRNSKWAVVAYRANGKSYTSRHRVQVPMTAGIGTPVTLRYDREHPEKLYTFSLTRTAVATAAAALFLAAAFLL